MIAVLTALSSTLFAQSPPPPPGGHGETGNQDPRGAPIDGGLGILLALGATYGGYKIYKNRKDKAEKEVVD
ncbi:MAG: hypothetical protein IH596_11730 [Bacteroidales bacterium]|nr:hypothetical protein [Bacteroidales bacterium]